MATVAQAAPPQVNYLNAKKGVWSWMTTVDHKRIGIMYLTMILTSFFLGSMFALVLRLALLNQKHSIFGKVIFDAENVQPRLHVAWRDHGLPVHHPAHSGGAWKLRAAADAQGEGRRFPAAEPGEFVHLLCWRDLRTDRRHHQRR